MFRRTCFILYEKKTDMFILKVMIKKLCNLSNENIHHSFILNLRGAGEEMFGEGMKEV